jgi:hypothetical protein
MMAQKGLKCGSAQVEGRLVQAMGMNFFKLIVYRINSVVGKSDNKFSRSGNRSRLPTLVYIRDEKLTPLLGALLQYRRLFGRPINMKDFRMYANGMKRPRIAEPLGSYIFFK